MRFASLRIFQGAFGALKFSQAFFSQILTPNTLFKPTQ